MDLSHLCEHNFRHNLQDTPDSICSCGDDIKETIHYLLHCANYLDEKKDNVGQPSKYWRKYS